MEIIWYGHSCFRLKDKNVTVITDPYDKSLGLTLPKMRADVITVSHDHPDHNCIQNIKGEPIILRGPGEYEIRGIFITGIASSDARKQGANRENTIFVFEMEELNICHLGDIDHIPGQEQVEALGDVHILLIPVGGNNSLTASQAAEVISLLEPRIVIPMHYGIPELQIKLDPVSKLFKEMGLKESEPQDSLKVTASTLPAETQVILLECKQ